MPKAGAVSLSVLLCALSSGSLSCGREIRPIKSASEYGEAEPRATETEVHTPPRQRSLPSKPAAPAQEEEPLEEPGPPGVIRHHAQLASFYDGLDALRAGKREKPVRIYWLGDSHTAADFMTHQVRLHLNSLAPSGGPGFVRLGLADYRHGAVRFSEAGKWRKAPILPSQRTRVLDGVFGYGGIRTLPAATAGVSAELREKSDADFLWTLSYRLPPGAKLEVRLGDEVVRLTGEEDTSPGAGDIVSKTFELKGNQEFSVYHYGGDPQVFGAFGEFKSPGVVFDTVGINGARAATVLAWEPEQFADQVRLREPELLVLAFGTNEVFDNTNPERYVEHTEELVRLAREGRPDLPCWVVGPPDSAAKDGGSKERVALVTDAQRRAAEKVGCAFTSAYQLMGGPGSFSAWARQKPARARGDRVHLTIAGYQVLGDLLARDLVGTPPDPDPEEAPVQQGGAVQQGDAVQQGGAVPPAGTTSPNAL